MSGPLAIAAISAFVINGVFFAYAVARKTDVVTDLSYSLSFAFVAAVLIFLNWGASPATLLPAFLTIVWAGRLGAYLFTRIITTKVDHRFDGMREVPLKFARFWILQAIAVVVILLPVIASVGSPEPARGFGFFEAAGALLWVLGFIVEVIADSQKSRFKRNGGKGFIATGLWKYSRHPNYFGESLLWWGIWVYALPGLSGIGHLSVLGPAFITLLLLFVSGIPLLEKSADAKYGADPGYREYKRRTSIFVPLPPRR